VALGLCNKFTPVRIQRFFGAKGMKPGLTAARV
jgi:hypothetical protein